MENIMFRPLLFYGGPFYAWVRIRGSGTTMKHSLLPRVVLFLAPNLHFLRLFHTWMHCLVAWFSSKDLEALLYLAHNRHFLLLFRRWFRCLVACLKSPVSRTQSSFSSFVPLASLFGCLISSTDLEGWGRPVACLLFTCQIAQIWSIWYKSLSLRVKQKLLNKYGQRNTETWEWNASNNMNSHKIPFNTRW